jgi:hypothetical protein
MIGRVVLAIFLSLGGLSAAVADEILLKKGESFPHARRTLLSAGWKPLETFTAMEGGELEHFHFGAGEIYRSGFREVESCMGTGASPCFYNYFRKEQCLFVIAEGEYDARDPDWATVSLWHLYPAPQKGVSNARSRSPFCSEAAANKTRHHIGRAY